ncbi:hypothetical protein KJ766_02310 [Patescibacteria group bacterium]|nr:hypothetical protein [Patescibacteria group bacterium]
MDIPIVFLLIPFGLMTLVATVFVMFNVFHIAHFGLQSTKTTVILMLYLFGFLATLSICFLILNQFDWSQTINVPNIFDQSYWQFPI